MTIQSFRVFFYIVYFLIKTIPERRRLHRLYETDPQEASRLANEEVKHAFEEIARRAGVVIEVEGLENIPDEPCLYVGNHCSFFDIVTSHIVIPGGVGFVAKDSLGKIPFLADWMDLIHCLFLNRTDIKEGLKTILQGVDYIKEGYPMFIFPEGTRCPEGQPGEFKGGSLKMAQRAKAPIVPVAISGSRKIFEDNPGLMIKPGTIRISFGKPFYFDDLSKEEKKIAAEYTQRIVLDMLEKQRSKDR
jgi:1-acyl-sn-glycerol-3-phosphate acyltransferase